MGKVVHCMTSEYEIYIGRPGEFGNPYSHKDDSLGTIKVASQQEAVDKFREYLLGDEELLKKIKPLKDKILGCWCRTSGNPNAPCHGDVILEALEGVE